MTCHYNELYEVHWSVSAGCYNLSPSLSSVFVSVFKKEFSFAVRKIIVIVYIMKISLANICIFKQQKRDIEVQEIEKIRNMLF